jgi:hydrogenase/urease accessory protein HupE
MTDGLRDCAVPAGGRRRAEVPGFAALALFCAVAARAHPQHPGGSPLDANLWHLLTEPDHLALLLAPLALAGGIWLWRRRMRAPGEREGRRKSR